MKIQIESVELKGKSLSWTYDGVFYARDIDTKALDTDAKRMAFILKETAVKAEGEARKSFDVDAHQDEAGRWTVDLITDRRG